MDQPTVFFDGRSNQRHIVTLGFEDALVIAEDGRTLARWPFADIRLADPDPEVMRLTCTSGSALARLELRDAALRTSLRNAARNLDAASESDATSIVKIVLGSLAAVAVLAVTIWFGIPVVADLTANAAPVGLERMIGAAADQQVRVMFGDKPCEDPAGQAALAALVTALQSRAHLPIPPAAVVLRSRIPNAFALPGGHVYILSALIDRARSADELGGVLAHEFGHVAHRDGLRRMIQDGGTGFLVGAMFGDVTGAGAALFVVKSFLDAAYSREAEANADGFAITVMHGLGRSTEPLGDLLQRIAHSDEEAMTLLRDHPLTSDRAARLSQANPKQEGPPLIDATAWAALKNICK
jgi:Zn-dependent protease with chaperone function